MTIPYVTFPVPYLTTAQMIEVDRAMKEDYGIALIQMMENAGRNLAHLARSRFLGGDPRGKRVTVLAGSGGNGSGALVAVRRLHNDGARVQVVITTEPAAFTPVPAHQLAIVRRMGISVAPATAVAETAPPDLVLDGIIGYSLKGAPRATAAALIRWANAQTAPILALDAPSGVDSTSGTVFDPAVRAAATLTLALPKAGLRTRNVAAHVGELYLADISVPPDLYAGLGVAVGSIFAENDIVRLI